MSIFISPQKVKIGKFQPYSACDWLINFTINKPNGQCFRRRAQYFPVQRKVAESIID